MDEFDATALVEAHNRPDLVANAEHLVTVAELRAALAVLPDGAYLVLRSDDDGDTPVARSEDGKVRLQPVWYNPTESTWYGAAQDIVNPEDGPDIGADVFAYEIVGVN